MGTPSEAGAAPGATLRLGRWVAEAPRDWSDEAGRRAASAFVDTAACMLAGADDAAPRAAYDAMSRWGTGGGAIVAGTPYRLPAPWAALVNGTAAHALDYDDILEISNAHVSAVLVPALLALGEERGADGEAFADAFIVGVEVMARLGEAVNMTHYFKGWHTTSTLGAPAAAAACARLLGLDAARTTAALSLASSLASGAKRQFGTMAKPLHAGLAAKNGVMAAALAESGVTAAADAYEGERGFVDLFAGVPRERLEAALATLDGPPAIERYGLWQKVYPCCGSVHRPLDALLALQAEDGVEPESVAEIDALLPEISVQNLPYPRSRRRHASALQPALHAGERARRRPACAGRLHPRSACTERRARAARPGAHAPGPGAARRCECRRGAAAGDGHAEARGWRNAVENGPRAQGTPRSAAGADRPLRQVRGLRVARLAPGRTRRGLRGARRSAVRRRAG